MNKNNRTAYILFAMKQLRERGSWCGETHVQKTLYLAQELFGLPTNFRYVLYKHGPYSFELSDYIQNLISDELVNVTPRPFYGPTLDVTDSASHLASKLDSDGDYSKRIGFLADALCKKTVSDLERIATAEFLIKKFGESMPLDSLALELTEIKPHVTKEAAQAAFKEVASLRECAAR